ncbi:hypothetical protein [Pontivivens ytuae]|uniref:Methyltransferase type 11 domain-containing protein n=1 Tax=Pontivivens ytuae TaxID=2789856 RepID=A0A7S9QE41_9RHOB|nr:hypothetical protein [Pontivivens ytuae]QPH55938.1 hypothetical protein I0K15_09510 [Pontivivens ytuae]
MGIDLQFGRALIENSDLLTGRTRGLMLGRQSLAIREGRPSRLLRYALRAKRLPTSVAAMRRPDGYADGFLEAIGAPPMRVMDYSDFEGADITHDLNDPVPEKLRGAFDFILDGGTIEHVFNTPQALDNVFHMLAEGGLFISINGMTGWPGHGFYQFSPELVWRYWKDARGCTVHRCAAIPVGPGLPMREVTDTGKGGSRFRGRGMAGRWYLYYAVSRTADAVSVERITNTSQGDYAHRWTRHEGAKA